MDIVLSTFLVMIGFAIGAIICIIIMMTILPLFAAADLFVNQPARDRRSSIHFFTKIGPGQVKIIVRGQRVVRMVTNTSGKCFKREGTINDPSYWELIPGDSEDPTADIHWFFRTWARIVYNQTGAVFTGIYPFQRVYEYPLERTIIERKEEGRESGSNLVLRIKSDYSDHFRTRQFLFPVHITEAETQDKIPLDVIGVAELEVTNPHKAAFGTDRWDHAIVNLVTDKVTDETKQMTVDQALTAADETEARRIAVAVESITADEIESGINIQTFRTLEINPVLDATAKRILQSQALATQQAKATRTDGSARADALRSLNEANAAGGQHSIATMQAEALVRAAEAASKGGGTIILTPGGGSGTDYTQAAILAELQKLNRGGNNPNNGRRNS